MVRVAGGVVGCLLVLATVSLLALSTVQGGGGGETRNEGGRETLRVCQPHASVCKHVYTSFRSVLYFTHPPSATATVVQYFPSSPPPPSPSLLTEALALNKELEFAAIQAVLRHLDDNHDGSVDVQESEEVRGCLATLLFWWLLVLERETFRFPLYLCTRFNLCLSTN